MQTKMPQVNLEKKSYSTFARVLASRSQWLSWLAKGSTALLDQGLVGATGFFLNILLARWLAPEQYGAYALAFAIFLVFSGSYTAFLLEPLGVFGPASYRDCLPAYLGKVVRLHFAFTFALALLVGLGGSLSRYLVASMALGSALWGLGIAMPGILLFWLCRQAAYVHLRPWLAARGSAVLALTMVALAFLLYRFGGLSPLTAFLLQAVAGFAASSVLIASIRPQLRPPATPPIGRILKRHWEYGRWMVLAAFVCWLSGGVYYVIIGALLRMEDVAALRALQNFVLPVYQFLMATGYLLLPWTSARFANGSGSDFRRIINKISFVFTSAAFAYLVSLLFFGKWLIDVVYGGRYTQFASLLPMLALPAFLMAAAQGPSIALRAMQSPSELFIGYTAGGIVTIVAGTALTRYWGLVGAALGMASSSLVLLLVIIYRYQARLKKALSTTCHQGADSPRSALAARAANAGQEASDTC
jgi:O-antigen/teichoic acid export membrane protein